MGTHGVHGCVHLVWQGQSTIADQGRALPIAGVRRLSDVRHFSFASDRSMTTRYNRSPRASRLVLTLGIVAVSAVAIAARSQTAQQPPTPAPTPTTTDSTDTLPTIMDVIDSMAAASPAPVAVQAAAPAAAPAAASAFAMDPATGRYLVNGRPIVGRPFVQSKMDGITKYEYANAYVGEAAAPEAPIVKSSHAPLPATATRRFRGIMVQGTLWSIDNKRSAVELRHFRPSIPGAQMTR